MGGILNDSIGRATSIPRSIGVLPEDVDSLEGVEAFVTRKKKQEVKYDKKSMSNTFLNGIGGF